MTTLVIVLTFLLYLPVGISLAYLAVFAGIVWEESSNYKGEMRAIVYMWPFVLLACFIITLFTIAMTSLHLLSLIANKKFKTPVFHIDV
tara:strand:- start:28214 stop:28480 length:267 start_codon:yes stop_codon:yes gene_type:complete